jgi:hypothetical protein
MYRESITAARNQQGTPGKRTTHTDTGLFPSSESCEVSTIVPLQSHLSMAKEMAFGEIPSHHTEIVDP